MGLTVLHVSQSADYGLARFLSDLLADQARRGWNVVFAGPPLDVPGVEHRSWDAVRRPGPEVVAEARALARMVEDLDPHVVHLHSSKAGMAGRLAVRRTRPTIFQPNAWSWFALSGAPRQGAVLWERLAARWTDLLLCCSDAERAEGEAAGLRPRRWAVVPNAVDTDRLTPGDRRAARAELGLGDGPLAACIGRLQVHQKGQDVLLAAWPAVTAAVPTARLVLVGDGPDRAALEAGAPPGVAFVGKQPDVLPWLRAADVVVQPSRYEGLSILVLEALSAGRPVVAGDAVGMREAVGDAGAVVPRDDPAALAAAVVERLRDPTRVEVEGAAARRRALAGYALGPWGDAIARLTLDVAAR
jgi:glycosyltransferase involved in cell wall biosynthesis